jgi:hypothetical protein
MNARYNVVLNYYLVSVWLVNCFLLGVIFE